MSKYIKKIKNLLYPIKSIFRPTYIKETRYEKRYHKNNSVLKTRKAVEDSIKSSTHERDGYTNVKPYICNQLIASIEYFSATNTEINVLDIGGAFGNNYRSLNLEKPELTAKISTWSIIELDEIVKNSSGLENKLVFLNWDKAIDQISKCNSNYNIILLSASLQYLMPEYFSKFLYLLTSINETHCLILDRLLINFSQKNLKYVEKAKENESYRNYYCNTLSKNYIINLLNHLGYEKTKVTNTLGSMSFTSDFKLLAYKCIYSIKEF